MEHTCHKTQITGKISVCGLFTKCVLADNSYCNRMMSTQPFVADGCLYSWREKRE